MARCPKLDNIFENFLATGNVPMNADLGLMQSSGKATFFFSSFFEIFFVTILQY